MNAGAGDAERTTMAAPKKAPAELPIVRFPEPADWAAWLETNHVDSPGVWLQLAKKGAALRSLSYAEALEVALCYGWIDGQKRAYDESSWLQKFTRRGAKSIWSKINREKAEALIQSGQMKAAGLAAVESAKADGRWAAAYDSQSTMTVPADFRAALEGNERANAFFATLNSASRYALLFRIQTAKKAETRARRIQEFIAMLERQEKLHP
jgi:uncharacterized protein YdeI (YjbR/CyaY-like superfamily)